jgi:hypothetical protein
VFGLYGLSVHSLGLQGKDEWYGQPFSFGPSHFTLPSKVVVIFTSYYFTEVLL